MSVVKVIPENILYALTRIFNLFLVLNLKKTFNLKKTKVIPVHKRGLKSDINNYRREKCVRIVVFSFEIKQGSIHHSILFCKLHHDRMILQLV